MREIPLASLRDLRTLSRIPDERKKSLVEQQFNLLIAQSILGLPIDKLLINYPQFKDWFEQIQEAASEIWTVPEHQKATYFEIHYPHLGYLFRTTYDLLIAKEENAQIHYWTIANAIPSEKLLLDWYNQLDLFLLVQTLHYVPEQISLIYWFLTPLKVIKVPIYYHRDLYNKFLKTLSDLVQQNLSLVHEEENLTNLFLKGKISTNDYLNTINEVEI